MTSARGWRRTGPPRPPRSPVSRDKGLSGRGRVGCPATGPASEVMKPGQDRITARPQNHALGRRVQRRRRRHQPLQPQVGRDRAVVVGVVHDVGDEGVGADGRDRTAARAPEPLHGFSEPGFRRSAENGVAVGDGIPERVHDVGLGGEGRQIRRGRLLHTRGRSRLVAVEVMRAGRVLDLIAEGADIGRWTERVSGLRHHLGGQQHVVAVDVKRTLDGGAQRPVLERGQARLFLRRRLVECRGQRLAGPDLVRGQAGRHQRAGLRGCGPRRQDQHRRQSDCASHGTSSDRSG